MRGSFNKYGEFRLGLFNKYGEFIRYPFNKKRILYEGH